LLTSKKYIAKDQVFARGGSAGGILMGYLANNFSKLYRGIIALVPFVDVVNTMFDDSLPLTQLEYNEWGNPHDKKYYDYIRSYSPYDNVKKQPYPNILITGGLNDPRVTYWEPTKWTAKLRTHQTGPGQILLKIEMDSGHGGKSGRFEYLKEPALEYAFLFYCLGKTPKFPLK
jgi:oligopeptidase B